MFSVIMPVYNGEKFISDAIESILHQTFDAWELIVVNDGSKDGTAKVLSEYENHPKIKIIIQENGGVSRARNTGILNAANEYIAFLDCDDLWKENHLAVLAEIIKKYPHAGLYATVTEAHLPTGKLLTNKDFFQNREHTLWIENFFEEYDTDKRAKIYGPDSVCITKEAAQKAGGFPVGCKMGEDLGFFLTVSAYYPVVLDARVTTIYNRQNSTATKDTSFDPDWYFFDTAETLYRDPEIPSERKIYLKNVMQWFTMRKSRHLSIEGRKKEAFRAYLAIGASKKLRKEKAITALLLILPTKLVNRIFQLRWRHKA